MTRYADIIVHRLLLAALERSDWWAGGEVSTQLFNNCQLQVSSQLPLPAT
jgi:exoribonuclease R